MRRLAVLVLLAACTAADALAPAPTHMAALTTVTWSATGGTITSSGLYTAGSTPGTYRVIASAEGKADTSVITICALASLTLNVHNDTLAVGDTLQLLATVTTSCSVADTSILVTWTSRSPSVASVVSTGTQRSRVTALAPGLAWIIGQAGERKDSALICVGGPVLDVAPATLTLAPTATGDLAGHITDCASTLGTTVTWLSRNAAIASVAANGTQAAIVTGVAAGSVYVVGTAGALTDSSLVTVTTAATGLPYAPAAPAALRTVNVSTQSQLLNAVNAALPGDHIILASGTYTNGVQMPIGKGGTALNPLVIRCAPGAIIDRGGRSGGYGLRIRGPYVQVRACTIQNALFLVFIEQGSGGPEPTDIVLDSLTLRRADQNGVVFRDAHRSYLQRSTVSDIGGANWTEGVYVGHSTDGGQQSDDGKILGNAFGPGVVGEHIDIKGPVADRSKRWLVQGNTLNATGTLFAASPATNGVLSDQGCDGCQWLGNTVTNINSASLSGFYFDTSQNTVVHDNTVATGSNTITGSGFGYRKETYRPTGATTVRVYCDNTGTKNVTCTP